jgi:alginate O-acetyltransferase complex protein AlgI
MMLARHAVRRGAGWNFIVFGIFTGFAMTLEFGWRRAGMPPLPKVAAWLLTMLAFLISLCFFRAGTPGRAVDMMLASVTAGWSGIEPLLAITSFRFC